jgi:heptose I phosphotransferase
MNSFFSAVPLLAASCLVLGLLVVCVRRRRPRKRSRLEVSPRYRSFFRQRGLLDAEHFLKLPGETPHIVSGHPDRHVVRIPFGAGPRRWIAFLKREHRVTWRTRLGNALAGFGFLSRSLREARTLQALQREDIPGPEWLAAGEDGAGRAFLLVREAPGTELRAVLRDERNPVRRRRIARNLGTTLARMHAAGFRHPDLYANHLFIDRADNSIHVLDWQRARLRRALTWKERRRDLAALHATVDEVLATPQERLLCLRAYWRAGPCRVAWAIAVRGIERQARRLLARRHIREKRQPPVQPQAWIGLDGEALCVSPIMQQRCGERIPDYLRLHSQYPGCTDALVRRWPASPGADRTLLVQRREQRSFAELWRRSSVSPEHRQAALLLRLQRHGIPAPQVLALGQRRDGGGRRESLLLTEPLSDTCSLEAWLACQTRRRATLAGQERRWSVLRQTGALLHRLHEASCYLRIGPTGCGLAVRQTDGEITVVLEHVESIAPRRRQQPRLARYDLTRMQRLLHAAGCGRADIGRFRDGYLGGNPKSEIRNPKETRSSKTKNPNEVARGFEFRYSGLKFISDFGFRISDFSLWRRMVHGVSRWCQRPDWTRFVGPDWPDRIMDVAITDRFQAKQGRSTGRWVLHAEAEAGRKARRLSVYLKRHYVLPWWQGLLATLWPGRGWSPALREWRHLEWARWQGVPVPKAVAAAEYIGPRGKLRSFLAVEELAGMVSLQEAIPLAAVRQDAASFRQWKRTLAAEMARLARMLHDRRCFHKDLYLCHFYMAREDTRAVPAEGWRGRLYLIDLHRLAHHTLAWRVWQTKDLAQLLYSSEIVGIDARDRLYFWRAYRGDGPCRPRSRWLRWLILYRWYRYRHHNARNRQRRTDG